MRILSVDDDPIILDLLKEVLASIGQTEVTVAESAVQALELLKSNCIPFDCFLFDIQMPEIDGIQLCTAIRSMPLYQRTPILMITAMSDKAYIDRAFAAGATDYVTKPFDVVELGARVRVAETLIDARRYQTKKILNPSTPLTKYATEKPYYLNEKLPVDNVDGVIDYIALENYVGQLSRGSLFGSTVLAFSIVEIDRIFRGATAFEFECLITDVAEAITHCLKRSQNLVAYAGSGTFVCVIGGGYKQCPNSLVGELRETIVSMELCYNDGRPILFTIAAGIPIRLAFRSGQKVVEALLRARSTAENNYLELMKAPRKPFFNIYPQSLNG